MSSDFEGFGNVLVEALHWGLPVVSTDCPGGPREILSEGRFGLLVPPADEEALATGMTTALAKPVDKAALRERASALSGADSLRRYAELLGARL
jgi:glycosyltransferase involved in cell wall biosynthesis